MYSECRHIFTSGRKCQSPALKEESFCYFHQSNRQRRSSSRQTGQPSTLVHNLPQLDDADAIQLALSDVVLALAANRIDPRRAQILIYGLQVASQNHRHRNAMAAKEPTPASTAIVRETHEHEDGTLIGPQKQSPEPEEIAAQKRPPSLGEILLREAEAMRAEREAAQQAEAAEAEQSAQHTDTFRLARVHAVADISSQFPTMDAVGASSLLETGDSETWHCPNDPVAREAAQLQRGVIEDGTLKSVRKATITEIWERLDFHSDRRQAARDLM